MSFIDDIIPDNASSAIIRKAALDSSLAAITISPVELYFGSLVVGEDQLNRDFTVTNTGKKAFRINDISLEGNDQFQLIGMFPTILKVGESFSMTVQYTSQLLGVAVGSVLIYTSLREEPYTIGCSGRVIGSLYLEAIQDDFQARITEESIVRADADSAEAIHRLTLEATLGDEITAQVTQEQIARVTRDDALAASIEALSVQFNTDLNTLQASILEESEVRASADEAEAIHRLELYAQITDETGLTVTAAVNSEQTARVTADEALASRIDTVEANYVGADYVTAQIEQEALARADADSALSSLTTDLTARIENLEDGDGTAFDEVYAAITAEQTARVDADEAMASDIETLTASYTTGFSDVNARIDEEITTRTSADEAISSTFETLDARMTTIESSFVDGEVDLSSVTASITAEQTARVAGDNALATRATALEAASSQTIRIFRQSTDPGTPHRTGDLWYNTGSNNQCKRWSGTAWEDCTDPRIGTTVTALAVTNAALTDEQTTRANADSALASDISSINAQLQISAPTNLLVNPGFDFGSTTLAPYWSLSVSAGTAATPSRPASSLDYSGLLQRLTCTGLGVSNVADLQQIVSALAGVKYTLQARVKTSVAGLRATLITQALNSSGTVLAQDSVNLTTTTGWQQIVLTQAAVNPAGTNRIRSYLRIYGTADISSAIVDWDKAMLEANDSASVWTANTLAEVLDIQANIDSETSARVAADGAIASSLTSLTASYNNSQLQSSGSMLPSTFVNGYDLWTGARTGAPDAVSTIGNSPAIVDDSSFGKCLEIDGFTTAGQNVMTKGVIVPIPGHTYEIRARVRLTGASAATSLHCVIAQLTSTYDDGTLLAASATSFNTSDIKELVFRFTIPTNWAYKYFRYGVRVNSSASPLIIRYSSITCNDVTNDEQQSADLSAAITTEQTVRASADSANATAISNVSTTVNGHTASINSIQTSINGLNLRWGLKLDSNGYVSGVQANNSGTYSEWVFSSAGFKISGVGGAPFTPFIVDTVANKVKMTNVEVDTLKIGSVTTPTMAANAVTNTNYTVLTAAATIDHPSSGSTAIDCTLTTLAGSSVHLSAQLWLDPNHGSFFYVDVYRDSTRLLRIDRLQCLTTRNNWPIEFVDAAPPAGAHTYSIKLAVLSGSDTNVGYVYRFMKVTEFKK